MDLIYFHAELHEAMDFGSQEFDEGYDWDAARLQVEALLARYGESIPSAQEVTEYERRMLSRMP